MDGTRVHQRQKLSRRSKYDALGNDLLWKAESWLSRGYYFNTFSLTVLWTENTFWLYWTHPMVENELCPWEQQPTMVWTIHWEIMLSHSAHYYSFAHFRIKILLSKLSTTLFCAMFLALVIVHVISENMQLCFWEEWRYRVESGQLLFCCCPMYPLYEFQWNPENNDWEDENRM